MNKKIFMDYLSEELTEMGIEPKFRTKQLYNWVYRKYVDNFDDMKNIPKNLKEKLKNEFTGVLTGKGLNWGGSLIRPEATGYGAVYFANEMLKTKGQSFEGKTVAISGSGNVAQYAVQKINQLGGKVVTLSDSNGFIYDEDGNYINSLNTIHGEGLYVKGDYAYIVNAKDGITIVNVEDINNVSYNSTNKKKDMIYSSSSKKYETKNEIINSIYFPKHICYWTRK